MRRSASASIVSDQISSTTPSSSPSPPRIITAADSEDLKFLLPRYDPTSHAGKKEKSRLRFAENAIHFIPLLLILCVLILWLFSNPVSLLFYMIWCIHLSQVSVYPIENI
ncbi:unnamed protein product [Cochlearia groenlandica]